MYRTVGIVFVEGCVVTAGAETSIVDRGGGGGRGEGGAAATASTTRGAADCLGPGKGVS